jgi:MoxR-like ATPase
MLNKEKLKKYLDNEFNVLLEGTHGLGKTAIENSIPIY